jgi:hypothetical protein
VKVEVAFRLLKFWSILALPKIAYSGTRHKKKGDPKVAQFLPARTTTALSGRDKVGGHTTCKSPLFIALSQGSEALVLLPFPPQIGQLLRLG